MHRGYKVALPADLAGPGPSGASRPPVWSGCRRMADPPGDGTAPRPRPRRQPGLAVPRATIRGPCSLAGNRNHSHEVRCGAAAGNPPARGHRRCGSGGDDDRVEAWIPQPAWHRPHRARSPGRDRSRAQRRHRDIQVIHGSSSSRCLASASRRGSSASGSLNAPPSTSISHELLRVVANTPREDDRRARESRRR